MRPLLLGHRDANRLRSLRECASHGPRWSDEPYCLLNTPPPPRRRFLPAQPSLQKHFYQCSGQTFTCIDCCVTFDRHSVGQHSSCVTEHQKYAEGATKPGGFAENGMPGKGGEAGGPSAKGKDNEPTGLEFLSERPPWKCR